MNTQYTLKVLNKYKSSQFIRELDKKISPEQLKIYSDSIDDLYEFQISFLNEKRTILKSSAEVENFIHWYNKQFSEKLSLKEIKQDHIFKGISKINPIKDKHARRFMELYSQDLVKLKTSKMERKIIAKRWYDHICICFSDDIWEDCNIVITYQGILEKIKDQSNDFVLFTSQFTYYHGQEETGEQFGIKMLTMHRQVILKAQNAKEFYVFIYYLEKALAKYSYRDVQHGASSFIRKINNVQFIVDAQDYYKQVAYAIEKAQSQVFICGWWISPQLPLIRPYTPENYKYRLDRLLHRKASEGVLIYLITFHNPPVIPNDSVYTERTLRNLHSNIKILTHPCDIIPGIWSHHQKAVIIDQKFAFMGGLDLCYGRYDSTSHPINTSSVEMYPGIEYNNVRIRDFVQVSNYAKDNQDRKLPRMPWHDVALRIQGRAVADLSNHFIQYWNNCFLQNFTIQERAEVANKIKQEQIQVQKKREPPKAHKNTSNKEQKKQSNKKVYPDDHYQFQETNNEINQANALKNVAKTLKQVKLKMRVQLNKVIKEVNKQIKTKRDPSKVYNIFLSTNSLGIKKLDIQKWKKKKSQFPDHCQLLRSASSWSIGLEEDYVQRSIQNAYLYWIKNSKNYIYIQNQFFISATGSPQSYVKNQIVNALLDRIQLAINNKQPYKVVIVMPLLPGMQGEVDPTISTSLRLALYWQYQTISNGEHSMYERLKKMTDHPEQYVNIFGLRQHGVLENRPVTQMIYIHTKLMIVDDNVVICGSANINDRSQEGDRDSQLALLFTHGDRIEKKFNGKPTLVCKKAHNLRVQLYCEHLGITPKQCEDPLDPILNQMILKNSKTNTEIYRQLFGCYPDDNVKKLTETLPYQKQPTLQDYNKQKDKIAGNIVQFPLYFLSQQTLSKFDLDIAHDVMS